MLTLGDLLKAHPDFCPSEGRYDDAPSIEEVWGMNRMTREEFDAVWAAYRESERLNALDAEMGVIENESERLRERTESAGVPKRYLDVPMNVTYLDEMDAGNGVLIFGTQGSGKTWMACTMLRGWLSRHDGRALFVTSSRLLTEVTDTYNTSRSTADVLDMYGRCPFLVIDDLGKESPTDHALQRLWDVLNDRYSWQVPTVVTTQYDLDELIARMGRNGGVETAKAIVSRLHETSVPVDMGDYDRRLG